MDGNLYDGIYAAADGVIEFAVRQLKLDPRDAAYARNRVLEIAGVSSYKKTESEENAAQYVTIAEYPSPDACLDAFITAIENAGLLKGRDAASIRDAVMDAVMLPPSAVNAKFDAFKRADAKYAMDWLYGYAVASDYVKKSKLDLNPKIEFDKINLVASINLARPETLGASLKKQVAVSSYPACDLCAENEGYAGKNKRALRTVDIELAGHRYFWQYSPYGYFRKHGVAVNAEHTPMTIERETFVKLCDFVRQFPSFFIGSNAALPGVGGSVLSHDHYQGGEFTLPLHGARAHCTLNRKNGKVRVDIVDWHCSALRVVSDDVNALADACEEIRVAWEEYSDPARGLIAVDKNGRHNAVSPTVYLANGAYVMTVILRSNITSDEFPNGVFCARPEHSAIKKESLGLLETQGYFVLPARLYGELTEIGQTLMARGKLPDTLKDFTAFYEECKQREPVGGFSKQTLDHCMRYVLLDTCKKILQSAAVFESSDALTAFVESLGYKKV